MGEVTFQIPRENQLTHKIELVEVVLDVSADTEAIVYSNRELTKAMGRIASKPYQRT